MKTTRIFSLLVTALAFAACTQTDIDNSILNPEQAFEAANNQVAFSTYMGRRGQQTRAGATGSINTDTLKKSNYGFGVFAYYTGTAKYAQNTKANFMYNQEVKWAKGAAYEGYIGGEGTGDDAGYWKYEPIKYWPNEIDQNPDTNTPDDDQDNDASNNQAYGSGLYGGNVSFFAYAPYVAASSLSGETEGIIKMNGVQSLSGNTKVQNPTIEYVVPAQGKDAVDLLWGTASGTAKGVTGADNAGITGDPSSTDAYTKAVLEGYTVNANLTKQKTTGTVGFAFKHALAKVGGSYEYTSGSTPKPYGLMIILDLDDLKGAETGGALEPYSGTVVAGKTEYNTKVTVSDITLVGRSLTTDASGKNPGETGYTETYLTKTQGIFDLATGQWDVSNVVTTTTQSSAASTTYTISNSSTASASLSDKIEEVALGSDADTQAGFEKLPLGVTTTAQNVYENEANPFVFIPGTWPELTVTVTYTVRTFDPNLSMAYSEVTQRITKRVTFDRVVELNKQYSLLMHLGLTSVKFTATVSDWEDWVTGLEDADGTTPVTEAAIEHVYVPRNVGELAAQGTETTSITIDGVKYIVVLQQEGIEDGATYFDTRKPINVTVYKNSIAVENKVTLGPGKGDEGKDTTIYFLCGGSGTHFHRGGEMVYNTDGTATMTTAPADYDIIHAPITVFLTINGKEEKSAATTVYIWPTNYLPY